MDNNCQTVGKKQPKFSLSSIRHDVMTVTHILQSKLSLFVKQINIILGVEVGHVCWTKEGYMF